MLFCPHSPPCCCPGRRSWVNYSPSPCLRGPAGLCKAVLGTQLFAGLCFTTVNNGLLAAWYSLSCSIYLSRVTHALSVVILWFWGCFGLLLALGLDGLGAATPSSSVPSVLTNPYNSAGWEGTACLGGQAVCKQTIRKTSSLQFTDVCQGSCSTP